MSLVESFRGAPARRQVWVAVVALAVIAAVMIGGYFLFLRKPYGVLFTNLRAMDAATIVADLEKKKIPYKLQDNGTTVMVPHDLIDSTRLTVMTEDLPIKGTVGFELFNKSDMGLTEFAQKINYQRALQGELARTIMSMESIDSARVHLSLGEQTVFRDDRRPAKASVSVQARPGRQVASATVRGIQRLVAAAVPDLNAGDVVVLDGQGDVVSSDLAPEAPTDPVGQERRAVEQYYAAKVRDAVLKIYPSGGAKVGVSAISDPAVGGAGAGLETWTPGARNFRLNVQVSFDTPPSPEIQEDVRKVAGTAIGENSQLGDVITVTAASRSWKGADSGPEQTASPSPWADGRPRPAPKALTPTLFWAAVLAPALALMLGLAWLLYRRRTLRRGLSSERRSAYARQLEALLDKGDVHVAPPV